MKRKNLFVLSMLLLLVVSLSSCIIEVNDRDERDDYREIYHRTELLCRNGWIDHYIDSRGYRCTQKLEFFNDGAGIDILRIEYPDGSVDTDRKRFVWHWDRYSSSRLVLRFGNSEVATFNDIRIVNGNFSGYWNNNTQYVHYKAY